LQMLLFFTFFFLGKGHGVVVILLNINLERFRHHTYRRDLRCWSKSQP
jgi:hypothetical protein